jgi:hypothetical protein
MTDAKVPRALEFYARATAMTAVGEHKALVDELPSEIDELARITQGLLIYDVVASDFYGCELTEERQGRIHIRRIEELIHGMLALDERPLSIARPFEDHVLCEHWSGAEQRWVLMDPQFDEVWRERLSIEHDHLDVPRDQFIVAAEAWEMCRSGAADPARFGIGHTQMYGLWFIAGSLIREIAASNKVEVLPWDVWGAQPRPDESLSGDQLAFFDELAALARDPDESLDQLRERYEADDRLQVPATVFNALLGRPEAI